jgi:hypothetical protein
MQNINEKKLFAGKNFRGHVLSKRIKHQKKNTHTKKMKHKHGPFDGACLPVRKHTGNIKVG